MPKVAVFMPPKEEQQVGVGINRLLTLCQKIGLEIDPYGFSTAWLSDYTRIFIATEGTEDIGIGIMAYGRRYYDKDMSASILLAMGIARPELLDFMIDTAKVLGCTVIYFERQQGDHIRGEPTPLQMIEVK